MITKTVDGTGNVFVAYFVCRNSLTRTWYVYGRNQGGRGKLVQCCAWRADGPGLSRRGWDTEEEALAAASELTQRMQNPVALAL